MRMALALAAPALVIGLASAAWADNDKDKGKGKHGRGGPPVVVIQPAPVQPPFQSIVVQPMRVFIPDRDRAIVYQYYRSQYPVGRCPPGLAKKGNGCLPPGQAAKPPKVWVVGQPLPPAVVYQPVPPVVVQRLEPVPDGYGYVQVDNDVLLMDMANRVVADVIGDLYDPYDLE